MPDEAAPPFELPGEEAISPEILGRRICDFDLKIEGRPLEKVIARFRDELRERGITRLSPVFYLTDEWGVPEGTVAIGMPFYLADEGLMSVQRHRRKGLVEGESDEDILRYLRHEMGHVVNYAYRLHATAEWTRLFGSMARPYPDTYPIVPFSPDFVRHLPGGYAQKHPDEDWAETFAVWMTPGLDFRERHADSPGALAKIEYCAATLAALRDVDPEITSTEIDYDTREIRATVQEHYQEIEPVEARIPRSLDGDLLLLFAPRGPAPTGPAPRSGDAAALLKRHRAFLASSVYRWTGVDPSLVLPLVSHFAQRAAALQIQYPRGERDEILVELSGLLTALAMNYQLKGKFIAT
ncbi:MAG: putative zinc-binding metallopeptidase [Byssovorax sp.]